MLERALEAGKEAVETRARPACVLKDAGVVDAGAYGLTVIVAGVIAALRGDEGPGLEHQPVPAFSLHLPQHESSAYRYCTNFAVTGKSLDSTLFVPRLEEIGDSVLVVGDDETLRVHVHTDEPDLAVTIFVTHGEVSTSTLPTCTSRWRTAPPGSRTATARAAPWPSARWSPW